MSQPPGTGSVEQQDRKSAERPLIEPDPVPESNLAPPDHEQINPVRDDVFSFQERSLREQKNSNRVGVAAITINGLVNGLLSAATLYLAVYTRDMAISTRDLRDAAALQLKITKESIDKIDESIRQSKRQAIASEDANAIARSNAKRQLRAYLVEERIGVDNIINSRLSSKVVVKNVGQTPAYDVAFYATATIIKKEGSEVKAPIQMSDFCQGGKLGQATLGSNDEATYLVPRYIFDNDSKKLYTKGELDELSGGKSVYIIWGQWCYKDIFSQYHFIKFCRYYSSLDNIKTNTQDTCAYNAIDPN